MTPTAVAEGMHEMANEGSPLLGPAAGPTRERSDADRPDSLARRALRLGERRDKYRRRNARRQEAAAGQRAALSWRLSAAVAGVLAFSMTLAGLAGVFSAIKGERTPMGTSHLEEIGVGETLNNNLDVGKGREGKEEEEAEKREGGDKGTGGVPSEQNASTTKPNVFFIMVDDMGYNDIGYQSMDLQGTTPNLDKLAAGGVKLTEYYTMSVCTPARASLMTGRYVVRYGLQYSVIDIGAPWGLPLTEKIFPEYMKDGGYETHMVGKWHLGSFDHGYIPSNRGFDTHLGYLEGEEMYWTHQSLTAKLDGRKFFDFGFGNATGYYDITYRPPTPPDYDAYGSTSDGDSDSTVLNSATPGTASDPHVKMEYSTQVFQDRVMEVLKEKTPFDELPLFMYLAHQAVHDPLGIPPDDAFSDEELSILSEIKANSDGEYGQTRTRFAKVLMYLDHTIGELVDYLEAEGWMENSIIVVASDNGGCPYAGGSNYPLRGIKNTNWEGGTKVPAFVYSTSHIPEERWGTEYHGITHVTDWLPTIATATGIALDGGAGPLDGIDHWEYIMSAETAASSDGPRQEVLYNFDPYVLWADGDGSIGEPKFQGAQGAFRSGKFKYLSNEWCSGWYTFNRHAQLVDHLTNATMVCDGSPCSGCAQGYCSSYSYAEYLFDLEADPREEENLIDVYPEIAHDMRERWMETALSEFGDSGYEGVDFQSFNVWANHNWWIVPWWDHVGKYRPNGSSDSDGTTSNTT